MTASVRPLGSRGLGLAELRAKLEGKTLSLDLLRSLGLGLGDKGKWGKANELLAGLTLSPSPEPDLDGGELKTTVRQTDGRFRESLKICMSGRSPMTKLEHIYLVIARDLNDSQVFTRRVVKNERVISLRPTARVRRALEFDELLLHEHPRAKQTHFLETRTAGTRNSSTRAYYIRANALDSYIAETVVRREFEQVERALRGLQVTDQTLRAAGISLAPKNRVGMLIAKKARAGKLYSQLRQGPVDGRGEALEDLLICDSDEDPLPALWRTIYVAVGPPAGGSPRGVRRVVPLIPTEVVGRNIRRDLRVLRSRRRGTRSTYFLKLKPHGQKGSGDLAFYLDRRYVARYVGLVAGS